METGGFCCTDRHLLSSSSKSSSRAFAALWVAPEIIDIITTCGPQGSILNSVIIHPSKSKVIWIDDMFGGHQMLPITTNTFLPCSMVEGVWWMLLGSSPGRLVKVKCKMNAVTEMENPGGGGPCLVWKPVKKRRYFLASQWPVSQREYRICCTCCPTLNSCQASIFQLHIQWF